MAMLYIVLLVLNLLGTVLGQCNLPTSWRTKWWSERDNNVDTFVEFAAEGYERTNYDQTNSRTVTETATCTGYHDSDPIDFLRVTTLSQQTTEECLQIYHNEVDKVLLLKRQQVPDGTDVQQCSALVDDSNSAHILVKHPFNFSGSSCPFVNGDYHVTVAESDPSQTLCGSIEGSLLNITGGELRTRVCNEATRASSYLYPYVTSLQCVDRLSAVAIDGSKTDGEILILAYTDPASGDISFYCGRYEIDKPNLKITLSINVGSQDFPECETDSRFDSVADDSTTKYRRFTLRPNYCERNLCENSVDCTQEFGSHTCTCAEGFTGTNCDENIDDCSPDNCQNGATCEDLVNGYKCACVEPRFYGVNCELENECTQNPCINGGTCQDLDDGYQCDCVAGFEGENCEINIEDCTAPNPCSNGGTCEDLIQDFTCECVEGYSGKICQDEAVCIVNNPCLNSGNCTDLGPGLYVCDCLPEFTGTRCETRLLCASSPCLNNGTCTESNPDYTCLCTEEYYGDNCQYRNQCLDTPCLNDATCEDIEGNFECYCANRYTGETCENKLLGCDNEPCENGATCILTTDGFRCACPDEYTGVLCETYTPPPQIWPYILAACIGVLLVALFIVLICCHKFCCPKDKDAIPPPIKTYIYKEAPPTVTKSPFPGGIGLYGGLNGSKPPSVSSFGSLPGSHKDKAVLLNNAYNPYPLPPAPIKSTLLNPSKAEPVPQPTQPVSFPQPTPPQYPEQTFPRPIPVPQPPPAPLPNTGPIDAIIIDDEVDMLNPPLDAEVDSNADAPYTSPREEDDSLDALYYPDVSYEDYLRNGTAALPKSQM